MALSESEIILSTKRLNRIVSLDPVAGVVRCQGGVVLGELDDWLRCRGFQAPLDLGASGSCTIGGNVATNAGGIRYLRYGSMHSNVLGLRVVLASGEVLDLSSQNRKKSCGLDLKHLFIGSEGTLGVITEVDLAVPHQPSSCRNMLLTLPSFESVLAATAVLKRSLGDWLSALELIDTTSVRLLQAGGFSLPSSVKPYEEGSEVHYLLVEVSSSSVGEEALAEQLLEATETLLEQVVDRAEREGEDVDCVDGIVAQTGTQFQELWQMREEVPLAVVSFGRPVKMDVSLRLGRSGVFLDELRRWAEKEDLILSVFGHLGDENLHLNFLPKQPLSEEGFREAKRRIEERVYPAIAEMGGTVSAEHGVGTFKKRWFEKTTSPEALRWMGSVKRLFDPKNILNPGKMLGKEGS